MRAAIVLAEDAVLLREGLVGLLERFGHTVAAAVGDADALLRRRRRAPARPGRHRRADAARRYTDEGLRAAVALRAEDPALAVLVLSQYVEQAYAAELLGRPAAAGVGYLLKDRIGDVARVRRRAGPRVAARRDRRSTRRWSRQLLGPAAAHDPLHRLTPREREVLGADGRGPVQRGDRPTLVVSDAAVAKHIGNIFTKLDLPGRADEGRRVLAVLAYLRA